MTLIRRRCHEAHRLLTVFLCTLLATFVAAMAWAQVQGYESLRIVAPGAEEVLHDNDGTVTIVVQLSPALHSKAGHRIRLLLDEQIVSDAAEVTITLTGIDRGTHFLQAQVTSADGKVLIASETTPFHMWSASRLFRKR